ncbi:Conserved_hypothetical protein [Hexamita inflata]|uniref:Uncharacterized protein n=1 Tax=Hexamita inflata TaxID=28002 RepID=A0AA86PPY6_9EUKA|nr:Conserved hypothetical protein [Hexamita inflata]
MSNEDSDNDAWMSNPLFLTNAPTQDEINKSVALQGIQALLYGGPKIEEMNTHRTQANTHLEAAMKQKDEERKQSLYKALALYNTALDVKLEPDEDQNVTQQDINQKLAIVYSNRSEAYRLLGDFARASTDAMKSSELDPNYFKSYLRLGRICEDLNDHLRAVHYFNIVFQLSQNKQILKDLEFHTKTLMELEEKYKIIFEKTKPMYSFPLHFGMLFPYVNLQLPQILLSYNKDMVTVFLLENNTKEIITVESFNIYNSFNQLKDLIGMKTAKFWFETKWCDEFDGEHFNRQSSHGRKRIDINGVVTVKSIIQSKDYIVPGVVCFFVDI